MNRNKLRQLGLHLPMLPTTAVGSYPKPPELIEARNRYRRGQITRTELEDLEKRATEFWIRTQEELGVDVVVDGEMYRGDMVAFFAERMPGFEIGGLVRSYGNRYYHKPIIVGPVAWPGPMTVRWWKFAQSLTDRPVKGMLTGPYTLMDWSFNEYYTDRKSATMALARVVHREVEALIEAGARIIQIDEPATSVRPDELQIMIEAMEVVLDGVRDRAYYITHMCYGDFDAIYPDMLQSPVDNFDLEMSNSGFDMLERFRRHRYTKDISVGVVDVHSHRIEDVDVVEQRIRDVLTVLHPEQVWIDPDCGLKTRTVKEAIAKMRAIVTATRRVREQMMHAEARDNA